MRVALMALETATRDEPGCQEFCFFQALSDDDSFVLLEEFESEAALQLHMQAAYTQHFFSLGLAEGVVVHEI